MDTLRLGSVDLNDGTHTWIGRDHSMGRPETLTTSIERLLTDGEVVSGDRSGNRAIQLPVQIMASTRAAAVAIEAAIIAQVNETYSPLLWEPQGGEPTVYDCFRGSVTRDWSILESRAGRISLTITLPALPFARTQSPIDLIPTVTTPVILDIFDAASGSRTVTVTGSGGSNTVSYDTTTMVEGTASLKIGDINGYTVDVETDTSFAAKDLTGQAAAYLGWQIGDVPGDHWTTYIVSGGFAYTSTWTLVLRSAAGTATWITEQKPIIPFGWQTVAWQIAAAPDSSTGTFNPAAVTSAKVTWSFDGISSGSVVGVAGYIWRDYLRAAPANGLNITTASGTARLDGVEGTARTPVDLSVVTNAGTAKRLLICRYPDPPGNFDPILSAVAGGTTAVGSADANAIAGTRYRLLAGVLVRYQRAATALDGTYTVMARMLGDFSPGPATVSLTAYISSDPTGNPETISRTFSPTDLPPVGGGGTYQLVSLGQIRLPPRGVRKNSSSIVNIDIVSNDSIYLDQMYLLDAAGEMVLTDAGSTAFSRFLLTAPDASGVRGSVLAGTVADGSDFLGVPYTGQPVLNLDPGPNLVLVVADKANSGVGVQATYYPRYHSEVLP